MRNTLINASQVIAPCHYLKDLLFDKFNVDAKVIIPKIKLNVDDFSTTNEFIVFVGDSRIKGTHIIKYLAKSLPKQKFKIFSRKITETFKSKNITYMPWQNSVYNIYNTAKLILIPSQCGEGYARISKESTLLGIPVLGSNHGGIPETLNYDEEMLVNDYTNKKAWLLALNKKLSLIH
jgi:glycosyltransferase involved in cell wall biosynthesis